ncbi:MAG: lasso peptide biosynthesis B2 protein [Cyanobium sp. CZS 25K]|nr:lasso peptide biosynthesis B2 protein [Cyanobium sp. CZS25K]
MPSAPAHHRGRWHRWSRLSARQRRLTLQAWLLLPAAGAAVRIVPLRRLLALLELRSTDEPGPLPSQRTPAAPGDTLSRDIAAAITRAAAQPPGGSTCLAQALVGTVLLHRHGRPAELTLAVANPGEGLAAHAWLESDGAPISGFPVPATWQPLVRFRGRVEPS